MKILHIFYLFRNFGMLVHIVMITKGLKAYHSCSYKSFSCKNMIEKNGGNNL